MAETAIDIQSIGLSTKDLLQTAEPVTVFHITPKENVDNILKNGLIAGERKVDSKLRERGNKLVDLYCKIFGLPVNRSNAVYAFLEDPRVEDADNLPYEPDKHAVLAVSADPKSIYVANSYHYEGVLAELEGRVMHTIGAHVEAIKYARSIVTLEKYKQSGGKTGWDGDWQKPEVLIPQKISPLKLKNISS